MSEKVQHVFLVGAKSLGAYGGYTASIRQKTGSRNIIFSREFLHESKTLYDNGYPAKTVLHLQLVERDTDFEEPKGC